MVAKNAKSQHKLMWCLPLIGYCRDMVVQNGGFYRQIQAVFRYHKYIKFLFFPTEGTMLVADWMEQKISQ